MIRKFYNRKIIYFMLVLMILAACTNVDPTAGWPIVENSNTHDKKDSSLEDADDPIIVTDTYEIYPSVKSIIYNETGIDISDGVSLVLADGLDENARAFLKTGLTFLRPFLGFALGASINILSILYGGISGIILALIQILIAAPLLVLADRKINKRPGYAAYSMGATAVISIATPQLIAEVDPTFIPYVQTATTQVATSVVITAIVIPILVTRWVGKYGSSHNLS